MNEPVILSIEDQRFGFRFGVDGVMRQGSVLEHLDVSRDTLERIVNDGYIRKKFDVRSGRPIYCRRSVQLYVDASSDTPV